MPGLGEIPQSATLRGYYHLEDVNDSSGNGRNLTNQNSVSFAVGKFTNGADFGSSGTNKGLTYGSNIFSAGQPTDISFSFWFKLNDTTTSNANARLFEVVTVNNSASGLRVLGFYNISAGNITFTLLNSSTTGNISTTRTITADSNWHAVLMRRAAGNLAINIDMGTITTIAHGTATTSGITVTYPFVIGNNSPLATQAWGMFDEFIVMESNFSPGLGYFQYYTQARGRFCI